jgi:DNA repair protein RecO (recombination protein O)
VFDQGVCVRVWDWSETSQTVAVLTREHGLVRGIAKGSKREKSGFSGGFEIATRGQVGLQIKRGDQLSLLTSWDLNQIYPVVRSTSSGFGAAMTLLEAAQSCVQPLDPHPGVFDALGVALEGLTGAREVDVACVAAFLWRALDDTGHKPELDHDVNSGEALAEAATYAFSPRLGGLVADAGLHDAWRVRAETVETLRGMDAGREMGAGRAAHERAARLLASYLRELIGRDLPAAMAYLRE